MYVVPSEDRVTTPNTLRYQEYSKIKKLMESARSLNIQGRDEDITFLG